MKWCDACMASSAPKVPGKVINWWDPAWVGKQREDMEHMEKMRISIDDHRDDHRDDLESWYCGKAVQWWCGQPRLRLSQVPLEPNQFGDFQFFCCVADKIHGFIWSNQIPTIRVALLDCWAKSHSFSLTDYSTRSMPRLMDHESFRTASNMDRYTLWSRHTPLR